MNQDNEILSAIRRQKAVYCRELENIHDLNERNKLKRKISILSEDEKEYLGRFNDV